MAYQEVLIKPSKDAETCFNYTYDDGVSLPLSYRAFGFLCKTDGGPDGDEETDSTWMHEDVNLIANYLTELTGGLKHVIVNHFRNEDIVKKELPDVLAHYERTNQPLAVFSISEDQQSLHRETLSIPLDGTFSASLDGNRIIFVYITGHAVSNRLAKKFSRELVALRDKYPQYEKFLLGHQYSPNSNALTNDLAALDLLDGGEVVAYIKFISILKFISEFAIDCQVPNMNEPGSTHRHLVILADTCFSGYWIKEFDRYIDFPFPKNTYISITVQTSTDKHTPSHGYYFTPLFVKLQHLDETELSELVSSFNALNEDEKNQYIQQQEGHQFPQLCHYSTAPHPEKLDEMWYLQNQSLANQPYVTIHNRRFFADSRFFAFFSHQYGYNLLQTQLESIPPPILDEAQGQVFLKKLESKEIVIRGIKLTKYEHDDTPLCIAVIRSPFSAFDTRGTLSAEDEQWWQLHIHYNGKNPFPGVITHTKLVYAHLQQVKYYSNGKYQTIDKQSDTKEVTVIDENSADENGSKKYRENLHRRLLDWVNKLKIGKKSGIDVWSDRKKWNGEDSLRLGNLNVRNRSRQSITENIQINQLVSRMDKALEKHELAAQLESTHLDTNSDQSLGRLTDIVRRMLNQSGIIIPTQIMESVTTSNNMNLQTREILPFSSSVDILSTVEEKQPTFPALRSRAESLRIETLGEQIQSGIVHNEMIELLAKLEPSEEDFDTGDYQSTPTFKTPIALGEKLIFQTNDLPKEKDDELFKIDYDGGTELDMHRKNLTDQDVELIAEKLQANKSCFTLDLRYNKITDVGAFNLAKMLNTNQKLTELLLSYNHITNSGLQVLCTSLICKNNTLKLLYMNSNKITDHGVTYVAKMLQSNKTLIELSLGYNDISDDGLKVLCESLKSHNVTLTHLYVHGNNVTDDSLDTLLETIEKNDKLACIKLNDNRLSKTGKQKLRELPKRREITVDL